MKTQIEIIKKGKSVGRTTSIRRASKLTGVAEVFIVAHLNDGRVSVTGYQFNEVIVEKGIKPGSGKHIGRPVGYKCSDETLRKMSEATKKRMQDPRVRRKLSVALSDYWIKKNKIQIDHEQQNQRT